jgi:hypothetical protein
VKWPAETLRLLLRYWRRRGRLSFGLPFRRPADPRAFAELRRRQLVSCDSLAGGCGFEPSYGRINAAPGGDVTKKWVAVGSGESEFYGRFAPGWERYPVLLLRMRKELLTG